MPDREKVMEWLNDVSTNPSWWDAYYSTSETKACAEAALALLKEQQKMIDDLTRRRMNNGAFD